MPDHGHDLLLGTFLTPSADDPQRLVDLARLTEQAGLDLVTLQLHLSNEERELVEPLARLGF